MKTLFPRLTLVVPILLALFTACSGNEVFSEYRSFKNADWNKDRACLFEVSVTDTISEHTLYLEIRNKENYPFRNLWLFIDSQTPNGSIQKDTLNCELADALGKWHGKGFSLHSLSLSYKQNIQFRNQGTYTYSVKQGMRIDELQGISDIGLRIVKQAKQ